MIQFFCIFTTFFLTQFSVLFAGEDITKKDYYITLSNMDPMSHGAGGSSYSGKGAILFMLQNLSEILLFMIPIIAGVSMVIAGYFYIFSSGDSEKASRGKTIIKWNIVAILVAFFSWSIIKFIALILS